MTRIGKQKDHGTLVLLVDGECAMCRGIALFAAKRDRADRLRFAALEAGAGLALRSRLGLALPPGGSFVLVRGAEAWTRSDAALRTLSALGAPWPAVAAALGLVPRRLRDAVYDAVASRRHRLAGRHAGRCHAKPDARLRRRLLDASGWSGADERDAAGPAPTATAAEDGERGTVQPEQEGRA